MWLGYLSPGEYRWDQSSDHPTSSLQDSLPALHNHLSPEKQIHVNLCHILFIDFLRYFFYLHQTPCPHYSGPHKDFYRIPTSCDIPDRMKMGGVGSGPSSSSSSSIITGWGAGTLCSDCLWNAEKWERSKHKKLSWAILRNIVDNFVYLLHVLHSLIKEK